jgi:hypothetical protein
MHFYAQVQGTVKTVTKVMLHAGQDYQLSSRTSERPGVSGNYVENTGFRTFPPENCEDAPAQTSSGTTTEQFQPSTFYAASLHRQVNSDVTQSLSAFSAHQFVASIPIWIRQPNQSYEREGTWNHLSGSTLPTLLPGAPSSPLYAPTGIAR